MAMRPTAPQVIDAEVAYDLPMDDRSAQGPLEMPAVAPIEVFRSVTRCSSDTDYLSPQQASDVLLDGNPGRYGALAPILERAYIVVREELVHMRIPLATAEVRVGRRRMPREGETSKTVYTSPYTFICITGDEQAIALLWPFADSTLRRFAQVVARGALAEIQQEDIDANLRA